MSLLALQQGEFDQINKALREQINCIAWTPRTDDSISGVMVWVFGQWAGNSTCLKPA